MVNIWNYDRVTGALLGQSEADQILSKRVIG